MQIPMEQTFGQQIERPLNDAGVGVTAKQWGTKSSMSAWTVGAPISSYYGCDCGDIVATRQ